MKHLLLAGLILLCGPGPALAHKLKLFVTVDENEISGYAFFVGGGRPRGAAWRVQDAAGTTLQDGVTDDQGAFRWRTPGAADYTVVVDAGDGHGATATLPASRFVGKSEPTPSAPPDALSDTADASPADLVPVDRVEALVARAVQRETAPLLARIEEMDSRLRLTDLVSSVFLILGAAGGLLWLTGRRATR